MNEVLEDRAIEIWARDWMNWHAKADIFWLMYYVAYESGNRAAASDLADLSILASHRAGAEVAEIIKRLEAA